MDRILFAFEVFLGLLLAAPGYVLAVIAIVDGNNVLFVWTFVGAVAAAAVAWLLLDEVGLSEAGFYAGLAYGALAALCLVYAVGSGVVDLFRGGPGLLGV